jgi:hypothetical protein
MREPPAAGRHAMPEESSLALRRAEVIDFSSSR